MASLEISILDQKFLLSSDEPEEHLQEVAELVKRRVEALRKRQPTMSLQKAAMLAALDFASHTLKANRAADEHRTAVADKAKGLLERVERELQTLRPS